MKKVRIGKYNKKKKSKWKDVKNEIERKRQGKEYRQMEEEKLSRESKIHM